MKTRNKIILYVIGGLLLVGFGMLNFSRSMFVHTYADVRFPASIRIDRIVFDKKGSAYSMPQAGQLGNTLRLKITGEDIHIPWTLYLPFYQFGKISGTLRFDAEILDKHWQGLSVTASEIISRYGAIPQFSRRQNLEDALQDTAAKSFELRTY